jgi:hypothetical protein
VELDISCKGFPIIWSIPFLLSMKQNKRKHVPKNVGLLGLVMGLLKPNCNLTIKFSKN